VIAAGDVSDDRDFMLTLVGNHHHEEAFQFVCDGTRSQLQIAIEQLLGRKGASG
jgi:hypothetical protein